MSATLTPAATLDYADARKRMVESQIRPNRITNARLLSAMAELPRERFVPSAQRQLAYGDCDVKLARGRVMASPLSIARLVQLAAPGLGERALVVGANTGYGAALVAACGASVIALESDPTLAALAKQTLTSAVTVVERALADGCPEQGPYDIILIEGAVADLPPKLLGQLRAGGRIVAVHPGKGQASQAFIAQQGPSSITERVMFDCALPELPGLGKRKAFVF